MDAVEDIKQKLSIEDVIADYLELKRSGRNFKALSPFSSERTPSFMVSPEKQIWHDFSSGKGGDIFGFVMEVEGVDFKGALDILARKAGVDLSLYKKGDNSARKNKDNTTAALQLAVKYYQQSLLKHKQALLYVTKTRHLGRKTITDFGIGYAPNTGNALVGVLQKKDISNETMKMAGLVSERYNQPKDMFRGRVMIPLYDAQGLPIGFTARLLEKDDNQPKYINTPQTILYDKSRHIFGLHLAKESIRTSGFVVIVEGNMDVISSHQAGFRNVVATAGTALTSYQLKALQRFTNDIRLCFDQDKAGIAAAERAIDVAQGVGVQLTIISLPAGKDPDDLISLNTSLWEEAINTPQYAVDWLIDRYKEIYDLTTANGKKQFSDILATMVSRLQDSVERDHYIQLLSKITGVSREAITSKIEMISKNKTHKYKSLSSVSVTKPDPDLYQDQLLALLVSYSITRRVLETSDTSDMVFSTPERQRIFQYINENPHTTITNDIPEDLKDVEDYAKILLLKAEELYAGFDANEKLRELQVLIEKLKTKHIQTKKIELSESIRAAEEAGDDKRVAKLLEEYNQLLRKG
ncbi:MAG: DNA primase [Patescibacteria group bacterium]|nr:DNA primase [Patescibacteria group bacterium]